MISWLFLIEQHQLVFCDIKLGGHLIFIGADKTGNASFDEFDGGSPPRFAVVSQGTVLSLGEFEGDRVVLITSPRPLVFFGLAHSSGVLNVIQGCPCS